MSETASVPEPPPAAPPPGPSPLIRVGATFYGIVALFAVGYDLFSRIAGSLTSSQPLLGLSLPAITHLLAGVAIGLVLVALTRIGVRVWHAVEDAAQALSMMIGPLTIREAIYLAAFSAVGEELLFRGALWPHLGLAGTTLLFGLVHFVPRKALWGYPLFATLAGLLLGILRESSGSVFPPIVAHFTINAVNLAWLGRNHARFLAKPRIVRTRVEVPPAAPAAPLDPPVVAPPGAASDAANDA